MNLALGIDQSTKTGFAFADVETGVIVKSGHYSVRAADGGRLSVGAALNRFEQWLEMLLEEYAPVRVIFEQPHFQGYNATVELVGFVAIILKLCAKHNIAVDSVHTSTLKKFATGDGRADKAAMTAAAEKIVGRSLSVENDNDEADAIHLVKWGLANAEKNNENGRPRRKRGR